MGNLTGIVFETGAEKKKKKALYKQGPNSGAELMKRIQDSQRKIQSSLRINFQKSFFLFQIFICTCM